MESGKVRREPARFLSDEFLVVDVPMTPSSGIVLINDMSSQVIAHHAPFPAQKRALLKSRQTLAHYAYNPLSRMASATRSNASIYAAVRLLTACLSAKFVTSQKLPTIISSKRSFTNFSFQK